ncbi:hypothetical protein PUN28_013505 [Cardiocondyla obscurior]|uniref:Uncharacterized protein n=1 Tax=Cardiocondyla obscurior TaxID=286306 RepID=A0AAW2F5W1_9HYME
MELGMAARRSSRSYPVEISSAQRRIMKARVPSTIGAIDFKRPGKGMKKLVNAHFPINYFLIDKERERKRDTYRRFKLNPSDSYFQYHAIKEKEKKKKKKRNIHLQVENDSLISHL